MRRTAPGWPAEAARGRSTHYASRIVVTDHALRIRHCGSLTPSHALALDVGPSPHHAAPRRVERVHDVRLVRPPAKPLAPRLVRGRRRELGHRALRVPPAGPGEPHRLHGAVPRA